MAQEALIDGNKINDDRPLAVEIQNDSLVVTSTGTVALTNDSIVGPGDPVIDSYTSAVVNLAASTADQELIATPGADKQIWVYGCLMIGDTADGTVVFQDEDDTALTGTMVVNDGQGFRVNGSGNFAMPWLKVATNKALEADTGACTIDGTIEYAVVSV